MPTSSITIKRARRFLTAAVLGVPLAGLFTACAGPSSSITPTASGKSLPVSIELSANVNPDARGRASPIVFCFYELETTSAFSASDFVSLFERDQATLGAGLIAREEWTLLPGQRIEQVRKLNIKTQYIGAIAAFRDLERSAWRATVGVSALSAAGLQISLASRNLRLDPR